MINLNPIRKQEILRKVTEVLRHGRLEVTALTALDESKIQMIGDR